MTIDCFLKITPLQLGGTPLPNLDRAQEVPSFEKLSIFKTNY